MKTRKILICIAFALLGVNATAQQDNSNRINVEYSFSLHHQFVRLVEGEPSTLKHINQNAVNISYGHLLHQNFELGIYCRFLFSEYYVYGENGSLSEHIVPATGIVLKYHLLQPMQINTERFDVAISSVVGGTFAKGCRLEYGVGLNVGYFPFEHIGVNTEARFGSFSIARYGEASSSDFQANVGLIFRW